MTKEKATLAIAAITTTLAETDTGPEGHLYMALAPLGISLDDYYAIAGLLIKGGLAERIAGPQLRITEAGRQLAARIEEATQ